MITYITSKTQYKWESAFKVKLPRIEHIGVDADKLSAAKTHFPIRCLVGNTAWSELNRHPLVSYCLHSYKSKSNQNRNFMEMQNSNKNCIPRISRSCWILSSEGTRPGAPLENTSLQVLNNRRTAVISSAGESSFFRRHVVIIFLFLFFFIFLLLTELGLALH